jgi:hypothetical protein
MIIRAKTIWTEKKTAFAKRLGINGGNTKRLIPILVCDCTILEAWQMSSCPSDYI